MYNFAVQLADVDRGVYDDVTLRAARHPSETDAYVMTRVLVYCLEYVEGIAFSDGISSTAIQRPTEPAVLVRDLTGRLTTWIEVGAPHAESTCLNVPHPSAWRSQGIPSSLRDSARMVPLQ